MILHPIGYLLDFFSIPISQPDAILASRTKNANMLKRDFVKFRNYKNLIFIGNTNFMEPPLKPPKDFV